MISNKNVGRGSRAMTVIVFFVFFMIFMAAAAVSFPKGSGVDIVQEGKKVILRDDREWYLLKEGTYEVLDEFEEFITSSATFYIPKTYYYFNVLVTDTAGEQFVMAVRTGKKTFGLRSGKAEELYGMISVLNEEKTEKQRTALKGKYSDEEICSVCLNDNDKTVSDRYRSFGLFVFFALFSLFMILLLWKR